MSQVHKMYEYVGVHNFEYPWRDVTRNESVAWFLFSMPGPLPSKEQC